MFTDIHHHIIYGVDDGPATREQSCAMLRAAAEQGVTRVICTSHAMPGTERFPLERYWEHLQEERDYCRTEGLQIELAEGCEILWDRSCTRLLSENAFPTLNGSHYVLVEFYPNSPWSELLFAARNLNAAGYRPIFAHVERFACLRRPGRLEALADDYEVLLQMNAKTALASEKPGIFGDRWPAKVLEKGLIDCIASDAHDTVNRPCRMHACYKDLLRRYGRETADRLCIEIPKMVWNDEII